MEVADALETFVDKNMFLAPGEGEVWDFTLGKETKVKKKKRPSLMMSNDQLTIKFPLPDDSREIRSFASKFKYYLDGESVLIGWGIKDVLTYHLGMTGFPWKIGRPILDLKILESIVSYHGEMPVSYEEAAERLLKVTRYSQWSRVKEIYSKVYLPLIREVLPAIETLGLLRGRKHVYPHYEIEGQANGRLKGSSTFHCGFNPHSIPKEEMHRYELGQFDDMIAISLDYSSLEVRVLQWLSKDVGLQKVLETGEDLYKIIWERITNVKCNPAFREKCKSIFLPVVYGLGREKLAERLKVGEQVAQRLIENIHAEFPDAMAWVKQQQSSNEYDGCVYDYFGRRRRFNGKEHKIRNFVVQAPASTICLHKLVRLHHALKGHAKIVYHVHDGYVVRAHKKTEEKVFEICKETLESPEDLYPGLQLKVAAKMGERLHELESV